MSELNVVAGWWGMALGAALGMTLGLWAESRQWAGGYGSFRRQALRLAHISAFALGIINVIYGMNAEGPAQLVGWMEWTGSWGMIVGGFLMPAVCLATAWRPGFKYFFPVPATCVLAGLVVQAWGWTVAMGWGV